MHQTLQRLTFLTSCKHKIGHSTIVTNPSPFLCTLKDESEIQTVVPRQLMPCQSGASVPVLGTCTMLITWQGSIQHIHRIFLPKLAENECTQEKICLMSPICFSISTIASDGDCKLKLALFTILLVCICLLMSP